jgi:hypothetical protein
VSPSVLVGATSITLLSSTLAFGADEARERSRFYGRLAAGAGPMVMTGVEDTVTASRPTLQGAAGTRVSSEVALALRSELALAAGLSGPLVPRGPTSAVSFSTEALADWYATRAFHAQASVGYMVYLSGFRQNMFPLGPTAALGAGYDFFALGDFAVGLLVEVRGVALLRGVQRTRFGTSPVLLLTFTDH